MSAAVTPLTVLRRRATVRVRRIRGALLVAGPVEAFELADSAEFVFRAIDGVRTVGDLGRLVAREYDVPPDEAVADVGELAGSLIEYGIVDAVDAGPGG